MQKQTSVILTAFHLQPSPTREVISLTCKRDIYLNSFVVLSFFHDILPLHLHTGYDSYYPDFFQPRLYFLSSRSPFCCFQRSEMALEAAHFIFYPLNIILPTPRLANYSQINNVPNLFYIISGSFCPSAVTREERPSQLQAPHPITSVITCRSHFLSI